MIKKIAICAVAVILVAVMLIPGAWAAGSVNDYTFIVNSDGSVTITAYSGKSSAVAIPSALSGRTVYAIGSGVFAGRTEIKQLYIANGISLIGKSAFSGCTGLVSVTLPESVSSVGESTFEGCTSLREINIHKGLNSIGASAFAGCKALELAVLPGTLTDIGASAFSGCASLYAVVVGGNGSIACGTACFGNSAGTTVYAPEGSTAYKFAAAAGVAVKTTSDESDFTYSVQGTGVRILSYRGGAGAVIVPDTLVGKSVIAIGDKAFSSEIGYCRDAEIIVLPDSVRSIGLSAFEGDKKLRYVRMPDECDENIGQYTFRGCSSLLSVSIPEGIQSIGLESFYGCSALVRAKLPASVNFIAAAAFRDCSSLGELNCAGNEPQTENKGTLQSMVSFAGVGDFTLNITENSQWSLTDSKWYPNGKTSEYVGYSAVRTGCDCFYVERIIVPVSCGENGQSEFYCPFCADSYKISYPKTKHVFVSTGVVDGIETFRCTGCSANYTKNHIEAAVIKAAVNYLNPVGEMVGPVVVTFHGMALTEGVDYSFTEEYVSKYQRVDIVFTGLGDFIGTYKMVYGINAGKWLTGYTVSTANCTGGGTFYPGDVVMITPDEAPDGMEINEWSINGAVFTSKGPGGAVFKMGDSDVNVSLSYKKIEVTTEPQQTEPQLTTYETTEPPTPDSTTEPVTTSAPETVADTEPYSDTEQGREYLRTALIWGALVVVSLAALIVAGVLMFKKE